MEPGLDTIELRARKWMKLEGSIEDLLDSGILELQITGFFLKSDLELGDDLVF